MGQPVVHWEFWSQDPANTSSFYEKVFDWKIRHVPELDYRIVETGGQDGINGGRQVHPVLRPRGARAGHLAADPLAHAIFTPARTRSGVASAHRERVRFAARPSTDVAGADVWHRHTG